MTATVIAVPSPISRVDADTGPEHPLRQGEDSTRMAPEHGRKPTATIPAEAALPAAASREHLRFRPVRVAAVLIMHMLIVFGMSVAVMAAMIIVRITVVGMTVVGMIVMMLMVTGSRRGWHQRRRADTQT